MYLTGGGGRQDISGNGEAMTFLENLPDFLVEAHGNPVYGPVQSASPQPLALALLPLQVWVSCTGRRQHPAGSGGAAASLQTRTHLHHQCIIKIWGKIWLVGLVPLISTYNTLKSMLQFSKQKLWQTAKMLQCQPMLREWNDHNKTRLTWHTLDMLIGCYGWKFVPFQISQLID